MSTRVGRSAPPSQAARTGPEDAGSGGGAPGAQPADPQALWRGFAEAGTVEEFYRGWLGVQCRLIAGVIAGAIFRSGTPPAVWGKARRLGRWLSATARQAHTQRRRVVVQHEISSSRRVTIVALPIQAGKRVVGVVVLALAPRPDPALQRALRQLEWGSGWLEALALRTMAPAATAGGRPAAPDAPGRERMQAALELVASAQGHERFADAATAFVTELATRLGCDRVSLGFVRAGRARVRAMSHTARLGNRTNLVRAIGAAMDEAIDQKAVIVSPAPPGAARVCRAHDELVRQGAGSTVCTVPFASGRRLVGALTLERPADRPFDADTIELAEAVAGLAGPSLEVLRREDRWLAAKAVDAATGTLGRLLGRGHLTLKLGTLGAVALVALLCLVTGDYRVAGRAVMEAGVQRAAVAPFSGYLREAPVRAGDVVRAGQVLAVLDDRELRLERARLDSLRDQLERQRALALAQGNAAQLGIARAQIEQTQARLHLVDDQLGKTRVVAGFDGVIVTGDLRESLGAPVDKGRVLFELAPLDAYRLVVEVDERDIADVAVGRSGHLLLASAPFDPVPFTVATVTPVATARDGRNFFRVEARLAETRERLRPGMEGVAKIDVDRRLLVSIWTRSLLDRARLILWSWWP